MKGSESFEILDIQVPTDAEIKEQRKVFNDWFLDLLKAEPGGTCSFRDVLRNQKDNLFLEWLRVRPVWVQSEIDVAKQYVKDMKNVLEDQDVET